MKRRGFTLMEALALLFIFSVITTTFYAVFLKGTQQIVESKTRLAAVAVANEKMEIVRNLDYNSIGTKKLNEDGSYSYGIPGGDIVEDETIAVNTKTFTVHTLVQYIDDPFDGKVSSTTPIDLVPNDYKRVKIEVSWSPGGATHTVALVSTFVPKGMEVSSGGGTLSLNVIDDSGSGVPQATVHITNTTVSPHIDITTNADNTGNIIFPGAPAASQSYRIQASKSGYYSTTTHAPYPDTAFNPLDIDASVVAAAFNQKTIVMDKSSDLSITTKDVFGVNLPSIDFHLSGGRKIGDTVVPPAPSVPVYSLDQDATSDVTANQSFAGQSSGTYTFTLKDPVRYQLLRLSLPGVDKNTFSAAGGVAKDEDAIVVDTQTNAALVMVQDAASGVNVPVSNASVHLVNVALSYDATVTTDQYGQAYFPTVLPALTAGTYNYTVTMTGYADSTGTIDISSGLKTETVSLVVS